MKKFIVEVMDYFGAECEKAGTGVDTFLASAYPTSASRMQFSELMDKFFPLDPDVVYSTNFGVGARCIRPYMLAWHRLAGNKGFVFMDLWKALVELILILESGRTATYSPT